jgi:hypothetical protein
MPPSDSPAASSAAGYSLAAIYLGESAFLSRPLVHPRTSGASGPLRSGDPRPRLVQGRTGVSQVTGSSVACMPWSTTPPGEGVPGPCRTAFRGLQGCPPPRHAGTFLLFGAEFHGLLACLPTHQPRRYRRDCKAGYRPAGLGSGQAGLSPAGRLHQISRSDRRYAPSGPAGPGRNGQRNA